MNQPGEPVRNPVEESKLLLLTLPFWLPMIIIVGIVEILSRDKGK